MRLIVLALASVSLAGCATPHVISGTEAGGIVGSYGWKPGKALHVAEAYCQTHGKHARVSNQSVLTDNMTFDCV